MLQISTNFEKNFLKKFLNFLKVTITFIYLYECVHAHARVHIEVRVQLERFNSLFYYGGLED